MIGRGGVAWELSAAAPYDGPADGPTSAGGYEVYSPPAPHTARRPTFPGRTAPHGSR
ncbi:hypothetical protein [Spongiactinospora rosea]|uniref:hypothetical protein n=1 Tax=Spongiactinospora rosea TaxID=2248750 RepID=UPI001314F6D2|nr:hypothetical protein [Spongiactinospora rosea]